MKSSHYSSLAALALTARLAVACALILTLQGGLRGRMVTLARGDLTAAVAAVRSPFFAQFQVLNVDGSSLVHAAVRVEVIPRTPARVEHWQLAGTGQTDDGGNIQVTMNRRAASDPKLHNFGDVINYAVYLVGPSGLPVPILAVPQYVGSGQRRAQEFAALVAPFTQVQLTTASATLFYGHAPTPTDTPTEIPTETPVDTPTETVTPTLTSTETVTPTATPTETVTPTATPTDTPSPTATTPSSPIMARVQAAPLANRLKNESLSGALSATPLAQLPPCANGSEEWVRVGRIEVDDTVVGELHTAAWVARARFSYGPYADSTIDVAIRYTRDGAYERQHGRDNIANRGSVVTKEVRAQDVRSQSYGRDLKAPFQYEQQRLRCGRLYENVYIIRAISWTGKGLIDAASAHATLNATYKRRLEPHARFSTGTHLASAYDSAVTAFGVKLGSTSGYGSNVQISWQTTTQSGCLYGNDGPPDQAPIVYAGNC